MGKKKEPDMEAELASEYERWEHYREHGGSDPFYDDAMNMNLIRNHIFYWKFQMEKKYGDDYGRYPEIYFRELPPEVTKGYMTKAAEIRDKAVEILDTYLADANFRYLLCNKGMLTEKETKEIRINGVLGYVSSLADALKKDDLVIMRRHVSGLKNCLKDFASCAEKAKQMINEKSIMQSGSDQQMTLFQIGLGAGRCR